MKNQTVPSSVENFDRMPASALVNLAVATAITTRSRSSLYRHFDAGELTPVRVGGSVCIRVSELRRLMGVSQ